MDRPYCGPKIGGMEYCLLIECRNLFFSYPHSPCILEDVSFSLADSSSLAILGRNGSGKSTLLRIVATLLGFDSGSLFVAGFDAALASSASSIRRRTAYVFQNPDSCFVMDTVREDAAFEPRNYGYSAVQSYAMADRATERYGIEEKRFAEVRTLSGGEKERAVIASASALDAELYLFDESLAFLDENARSTMLSLVAELKGEGKSIVFVTQNSEDALLFDDTLLLSSGHVVATGPSREILRDTSLLCRCGIRPTRASSVALDLQARGMELPFMPVDKEELCLLCRM